MDSPEANIVLISNFLERTGLESGEEYRTLKNNLLKPEEIKKIIIEEIPYILLIFKVADIKENLSYPFYDFLAAAVYHAEKIIFNYGGFYIDSGVEVPANIHVSSAPVERPLKMVKQPMFPWIARTKISIAEARKIDVDLAYTRMEINKNNSSYKSKKIMDDIIEQENRYA